MCSSATRNLEVVFDGKFRNVKDYLGWYVLCDTESWGTVKFLCNPGKMSVIVNNAAIESIQSLHKPEMTQTSTFAKCEPAKKGL